MNSNIRKIMLFATLSVLFGVCTALSSPTEQDNTGGDSHGSMILPKGGVPSPNDDPSFLAPLSPPAPSESIDGEEIAAQLLFHNQLRDAQLKRYGVVRTYEVRNHKGELSAQEIVRMEYVAPDKKTFEKTTEKGSGTVRHMVFDRLMKSEADAASGKEHHDSALTPVNYTFTRVGVEDVGQYHCYVVEALPRRKDKYLFEGTIWIDTHDFAVVKIAGHPAKKPSFWIERADFVRQYQKIGDFWLPYKDETTVHVRLFGEKRFTIDHQQYSINGNEALVNNSAGLGLAPQ